jgi:hypothetical protein
MPEVNRHFVLKKEPEAVQILKKPVENWAEMWYKCCCMML